jgi:hypothetical protein
MLIHSLKKSLGIRTRQASIAVLMIFAVATPCSAYRLSIGPPRAIPGVGGEAQSTVIGPDIKTECHTGLRFLVTSADNLSDNDNGQSKLPDRSIDPGVVIWMDINPDDGAAGTPQRSRFVNAPFVAIPGFGANPNGESKYRHAVGQDHDLITLDDGTVLLVIVGESVLPDDSIHGAWWNWSWTKNDSPFTIADGPGIRTVIWTWRSQDCGQTFQFVSEIDPASGPHRDLTWPCALPQVGYTVPYWTNAANEWADSNGTPFNNKTDGAQFKGYNQGGTDGPMASVDHTDGSVYLTYRCVGNHPKPKSAITTADPIFKPGLAAVPDGPIFELDENNLVNRTLVYRSVDAGATWSFVGQYIGMQWRAGVVPLDSRKFEDHHRLAFANSGTIAIGTSAGPAIGTKTGGSSPRLDFDSKVLKPAPEPDWSGRAALLVNFGPATTTFVLTNSSGSAPAGLSATGGTPQTMTAGGIFAETLAVTLRDSAGNPRSGVQVYFSAPSSGASAVLGNIVATTNDAGVAGVVATANDTAGSYPVSASVTLSDCPTCTEVTFGLTNLKADAPFIAAIGGAPQTAALGAAFAAPLRAAVRDGSGSPLQGAWVTFTQESSASAGATLSSQAVTNADGVASVFATAGGTPGTYKITASVGSCYYGNVFANSLIARDPIGGRVLFTYPSNPVYSPATGEVSAFGQNLYLVNPNPPFIYWNTDPVLPQDPANGFVVHLSIIDLGVGPLLLYWVDLDTKTNKATVMGRFLFRALGSTASQDLAKAEERGRSDDFAISDPFDPCPRTTWYGDYHMAFGYKAVLASTPANKNRDLYYYYPAWIDAPNGAVRFRRIGFDTSDTAPMTGLHVSKPLKPLRWKLTQRKAERLDFSKALELHPVVGPH